MIDFLEQPGVRSALAQWAARRMQGESVEKAGAYLAAQLEMELFLYESNRVWVERDHTAQIESDPEHEEYWEHG